MGTLMENDCQIPVERGELVTEVCAELRAEHPRLTERQVELIAELIVDVRLAKVRLGARLMLPAPAADGARSRTE